MSERKPILVIDNLAVESSRRSLYRELAHRGEFEVHLLVPNSWKEQGDVIYCQQETDESLIIHRSGFLFGYRTHRVIYTGLFRALRLIKPHFLYVIQEPENYAAFESLILRNVVSPSTKLGLSSARIVDYRQIGFPYKLSFLHRICDGIARKYRVDICFVRAKAAAQFVAPYAYRVSYLPHSVDSSFFKKMSGENGVSTRTNFTIGFLGRLVEEKGIHLLIRSLVQLPQNVHLLVVGRGPLLAKLRSLARDLEVENRITFLRPVPYVNVPRILNEMDILVLPSIDTKYSSERFGRVLIEGMACEVPVVASDSGGIPDVVGDAGLLFRAGDENDLAKKLLLLLYDNALRTQLAKKGRARVLRMYDVPVIAERLADSLRDILGNGR
jgi:glycosyltransferase involved in cell wall biosynthesis